MTGLASQGIFHFRSPPARHCAWCFMYVISFNHHLSPRGCRPLFIIEGGHSLTLLCSCHAVQPRHSGLGPSSQVRTELPARLLLLRHQSHVPELPCPPALLTSATNLGVPTGHSASTIHEDNWQNSGKRSSYNHCVITNDTHQDQTSEETHKVRPGRALNKKFLCPQDMSPSQHAARGTGGSSPKRQ